MPKISGVEFECAWSRRVTIAIDEALTVSFISRADLVAAKIAAGSAQDFVSEEWPTTSDRRLAIELTMAYTYVYANFLWR
ncbi:MAG: hypothetical protein M3N91_01075 [Pseudomonadota bacterium]|nr:hypothetical protein [Pseudomonadota bacterium]